MTDESTVRQPSVFVIGLPCSFTTAVYQITRLVLNLNQPTWTTDGEILNADRFALTPPSFDHASLKYTTRSTAQNNFERHLEFLHHVVQSEGFGYKDVVQPYVVAEFLSDADLPSLFIDRPVVDVAQSMLAKGWAYPAQQDTDDHEIALLRGLAAARTALKAVARHCVSYADIIADEETLRNALLCVCPDRSIPQFRFRDEAFIARTKEIMTRRKTVCSTRLVRKYTTLF